MLILFPHTKVKIIIVNAKTARGHQLNVLEGLDRILFEKFGELTSSINSLIAKST